MNKKVIIANCNQCPYYSNEDYHYYEECLNLGRVIKGGVIPEDCPLETTEEKES